MPAWIFKLDASSAYQLLPCHPRWQVQQATMIDGSFHIDQCCVFSNCASGAIWCAFYALVLWAGVNVKGLPDLLRYADNAFSFEPNETLEFYALYDSWYPKKQVGLLKLFDKVGIPHEKRKQEYGQELTIIRLQVSLDSLTIMMPFEKHENLIDEISQFLSIQTGHLMHTLCCVQHSNLHMQSCGERVFPLLQSTSISW